MLPMMRNDTAFGWMPGFVSELFNEFPAVRETQTCHPAINVEEDKEAYHMHFGVPGVTKDQAKVQLTREGNLLVKIEQKKEDGEHTADGKRWLRREFSYEKYSQLFTLPEDVECEKIAATVADGVLTITLPKKTADAMPTSRMIDIK